MANEIIERWETPIVDALLPGISLVHRDLDGLSVYIHDGSGSGFHFYFEPIAFKITDERGAIALPQLSAPIGCTAICRNSKWIDYLARESAAVSMGTTAKKAIHYIIYGGSWVFETVAAEEPLIERLETLPLLVRDKEL